VINTLQHPSEMLACCIVCANQLCTWLLRWPNGAWELMPAMSVPW